MNIHLVSLGCARNLVDSESMLGRLRQAGHTLTSEPDQADVVIVNTCSFIESAADESIETILELAELKKTGRCRRLIVTGCLPERYREEILGALPEVDVFLGTGAYDQIVEAVDERRTASRCILPDPDRLALGGQDTPRSISTGSMAYLKIAEGCSRHCTYCIIPRLRGTHRSRMAEDILTEARRLIAGGFRELVLVAQDTTAYGLDLTPAYDLGRLVLDLSELDSASAADNCGRNQFWIRTLYGHPESIRDSFVDAVASRSTICSYFDIPIQHAATSVLRRMGRRYTRDKLLRLFDTIRTRVPDAALRTTVIVGFPGETDKDFAALMKFINRVRFDHLGVFEYSDSDDLPSHRLPNHVSRSVTRQRYDELMSRQQQISLEINRGHVGREFDVLVEEAVEDGLFAGRTAFQAPEVDGITYVHADDRPTAVNIGCFVRIRITDALEYDLIGELI
jgi:ribosomal protein S12 methylthiotransferase